MFFLTESRREGLGGGGESLIENRATAAACLVCKTERGYYLHPPKTNCGADGNNRGEGGESRDWSRTRGKRNISLINWL